MEEVVPRRSATPWLRFLARKIDLLLFGLISVLPLGIVMFIAGFLGLSEEGMDSMGFEIIFGFLFLVVMVAIESSVLTRWQITPGKKILGIILTREDGQKITFSDAFERTARMWFSGLGFGLPFVSILTQAYAYTNLKETDTTSWDNACKMRIGYKDIGIFRMGISLCIVALAMMCEYLLLYADKVG